MSRTRTAVLVLGLVAVLVAGAVVAVRLFTSSPRVAPDGNRLTVGLGFIPSVQFAPFYYAQREGLYADRGLSVEFQNKIDPDLITLVGQGSVDMGLADGTSVIPAVSNGIPIRYVASVYRAFPSIVFAKASSGIDSAADLEGATLGIPGRFGSSWIMLQALLDSAGLTPEDLTIREYPDFGQGVAVQQGVVDAATGFLNNEPIQLELSGEPAVVLSVDDIVPLPGPGLIAGAALIASDRATVEAFVEATLEAMGAIAANPDAGLDAAIAAVPELAQNREAQAAILAATIDAWAGGDGAALGTIVREDWDASIAYLTELRLVPNPVGWEAVVDASLLPVR
jgi:NitT/TauT family transport system substrate-binding protein